MKSRNNLLSGGLIICAVLYLALFEQLSFALIRLGELVISNDGYLDSRAAFLVKLLLALLIAAQIIIGVSIYFKFWDKALNVSSQLVDWPSLRVFFLKDELCHIKWLPRLSILLGSIYGTSILAYFLQFGPPKVEGVAEELNSLLFLICAIILLVSVSQLKSLRLPKPEIKDIRIALYISAIVLVFIYGEEISWGQRIFEWEAKGVFQQYNWQQETNTHNFFNPIFRFVYPIVGIGSFILLCFIWFFPKERSFFYQLFLPAPNAFFITLFMAASTLIYTEIYEQLLAVFLTLHCTRIFLILRNMGRGLTHYKIQ